MTQITHIMIKYCKKKMLKIFLYDNQITNNIILNDFQRNIFDLTS